MYCRDVIDLCVPGIGWNEVRCAALRCGVVHLDKGHFSSRSVPTTLQYVLAVIGDAGTGSHTSS